MIGRRPIEPHVTALSMFPVCPREHARRRSPTGLQRPEDMERRHATH